MNERLTTFSQVRNKLKSTDKNSCLTPKQFDIDSQLYDGYTINNIVELQRQIGTISKYGVIYQTSVDDIPMAAKLVPNDPDNKKEVELNFAISYHIMRPQLSRHFLLCYKSFHCRKLSTELPANIQATDYYVTLNELATGDLFSLCIKKTNHGSYSINTRFLNDSALVLDTIFQCIFSIATFHKLGWVHQDSHHGNFLYTKSDETPGYYHYVILGKDFYLKNSGYTMMLYDFGLAEPYTFREPKYYSVYHERFDNSSYDQSNKSLKFKYDYYDYRIMLSKFFSSNGYYPYLASAIKPFIVDLFNLTNPNKYRKEDRMIQDMLDIIINKCPIKGIITTTLPTGETIINATKPYIIDDTLRSKMPKKIYHKSNNTSAFHSAPLPSPHQYLFTSSFQSVPNKFTPKSSPKSFPKTS